MECGTLLDRDETNQEDSSSALTFELGLSLVSFLIITELKGDR